MEKGTLVDFAGGKALAPVPNHVAGTMRMDNALVCHRGTLYSLGGSLQYSKTQVQGTADVFCYREDTNSWEQMASMSESRSRLAAIAVGEWLW